MQNIVKVLKEGGFNISNFEYVTKLPSMMIYVTVMQLCLWFLSAKCYMLFCDYAVGDLAKVYLLCISLSFFYFSDNWHILELFYLCSVSSNNLEKHLAEILPFLSHRNAILDNL